MFLSIFQYCSLQVKIVPAKTTLQQTIQVFVSSLACTYLGIFLSKLYQPTALLSMKYCIVYDIFQKEQHTFKNINNCLNTNIYSYFETSVGQSSNPHLNVVHFINTRLIRNLRQHKAAVFLHWCLICVVPLTTATTCAPINRLAHIMEQHVF